MAVPLEPQRKGRRGIVESDTTFRREVRRRLVDLDLPGWPRAPLAVDFGFSTTRQQPAGIEAYAKHYQDLLEPRARDDDVPPFLYCDDRQIKLLFVRCWHGWGHDRTPQIALTCKPRRHVIAELEAAGRLGFSDDDHEDDSADVDEPWYLNLAVQRLCGTEEERVFADLIAKYAEHEAHRAYQDSLLHANDRHLSHMLVSRASSVIARLPDPAWRRLTRLGRPGDPEPLTTHGATERSRELLDMLIQVSLPPLPVERGGGERFHDAVIEACQQFVDRHALLHPLLVPLRITLLVVPPARGKDLDNIVLTVIGAVNGVLEPHPEPWLLAPSLGGPDLDEPRRRDAIRRLCQTVQVGVASYQVIELARTEGDSEAGTLTMVLGHGDNLTSTWEAAADFVDARLERDD
ncbi:MAG: hypothetical protein M3083_22420 [Actinomycetota bacterium]|nr:hypothetical protein [Actinomycetota bacterium]MDQ6944804.1 hypothetical protein [Actinomycetota bacterium]